MLLCFDVVYNLVSDNAAIDMASAQIFLKFRITSQ